MTLLHISTVGDKILREKAKPVTEFNDEIRELANNMADTMRAADGLGIAGPQVGVSLRIFVIDFGYLDFVKAEENGEKPKSAEFRPIAFINPEITEKEGKIVYGEGCLSVPRYNADVERAETIVCKYFDVDGNQHEIKVSGLPAVAIQHENDHLDGVLFIDKISSLKRGIALKKVKKFLGAVRENGSKTETALYGKQ
ncbi:peptide deformylase [bacterium]|jgi:peptide deformylase|nr:peptide deformylase [bacterium]MBP5590267.1 peptide deformylase [bacterium]